MAARTISIDDIITQVEETCDIQNDAHISPAEKFRVVNSAIAEVWDMIINAGLGEKYVKSVSFSTTAGTLEYPIFSSPVNATDFYRIHRVYAVENTTNLRPLMNINPAEIQSFRAPVSASTVKLYYIPYSPVLTTGQTFDGINGWEELVVLIASMKIKIKKDDSYNQLNNRANQLKARLAAMGQVDFGEPRRVVRKRRSLYDPFLMFNNSINAYLVRGDKLELFYNAGYAGSY